MQIIKDIFNDVQKWHIRSKLGIFMFLVSLPILMIGTFLPAPYNQAIQALVGIFWFLEILAIASHALSASDWYVPY